MKNNELKQFFKERPALAKSKVAEEAGIGRRTLLYMLDNNPRRITDEQEKKLLPVIRKYGWRDV